MVLLTAVLALMVQLYAVGSGWDRKGWHFHALWQFQLMGICGRLPDRRRLQPVRVLRGAADRQLRPDDPWRGEMRLRAGVQYIAYNLAGSTLFLAALGCFIRSPAR